MTASSRGPQAVVPLLRRAPQICTRCALTTRPSPAWTPSRHAAYYSSTTSSPESSSSTTLTSPNILPVSANPSKPPTNPTPVPKPKRSRCLNIPKSHYHIRAGLILSRPPILTRQPTPFESAFYLYQKRLNERIGSPFARQFYFRQGQPAALDFAIRFSERGHTMQREIGRMTRRGKTAWADELLLERGRELADPDYVREALYTDAESRVSEDGEALSFEDRLRIERPLGRETEADRQGNVQRLDRKLDRTLYLVVKDTHERWVFPQADVEPEETLYDTASRALAETAGVNMNTWIIGRHPIAYYHVKPMYNGGKESKSGRSLKARGAKVFYLKGRIMAGQADLTENILGCTDFKWLIKEELKEVMQSDLYSSVEPSLPAR